MARRKHADLLEEYRTKRRFGETPEPQGGHASQAGHLYTIQKHDARRLHYDLRLELDGVLKSWAVTRGPSFNPSDKRLAVRTEDHPMDYATFEGTIPEGNYGAGTVMLWDRGTWEPEGDAQKGLKEGKLAFTLHGERLKGRWALVRFRGQERAKRENWLLIKEKDDFADPERDITTESTSSVSTGRSLTAIAADKPVRAEPAASLPSFIPPQLATLVDEPPAGKNWLFEVKFDGYRILAAVAGKDVRLYTRNGLDWTDRFPGLARAFGQLDLPGVLIDGEVTVVDAEGRPDFGALQRAIKGERAALSYFAFDLLTENKSDLRKLPLIERKERLRVLLGAHGRKGPVFYTDHVEQDGSRMLGALCERNFEGIVAKRADAPYRSERTRSWLKIKCGNQQEFVIIGWSPSNRNRAFASILIAQHDDEGTLRYAGRVGSGFSDDTLAALSARFRTLARKTPPVDGAGMPASIAGNAHWVKPDLVAQIAFAEFTRDGLVRHGRFLGLREDKPAIDVERERAEPVVEVEMSGNEAETVAGINLTHPGRVLYPQQGITKRDLALYLEAAATRMLPHAARRLISLVRCPQGRAKKCFFQRHGGAGFPETIQRMPVRLKDGSTEDYLYIEDLEDLLSCAQMGVLEFHIWGSRVDNIERPDRLVFDLDPDPSLTFADVRDAAFHMRDALDALGLQTFPLLTGGKGVHVVAPLQRRHGWDTVKAFARALAIRMAEDQPERYIATMSKAKRKGRIFIDYLRNERGSTAIAPYSPRAREGAPVAWPVTWQELEHIEAANIVNLANAMPRLADPDPWAGYDDVRQGLRKAALDALGVK